MPIDPRTGMTIPYPEQQAPEPIGLVDPSAQAIVQQLLRGGQRNTYKYGFLGPIAQSVAAVISERKARETQAAELGQVADMFKVMDPNDPKSIQEAIIRLSGLQHPMARALLGPLLEERMRAPERARQREVQDREFSLSARAADRADMAFAETLRMNNEELALRKADLRERISSNASAREIARAKIGADALEQRMKLIEFENKRSDSEQGVRKEYVQASKIFRGALDAYARIERASDTPSGDTGLIFGYMKMLDPESVVREGEQATVQNSAGIPERVRTMYNRMLTGERLSPRQRSEIKQEAGQLFAAQGAIQLGLEEEFKAIADRAGYDTADAVPDLLKGYRQQIADLSAQYAGRSHPDAAAPDDAQPSPMPDQQSMQIAPGGLGVPPGLPPGSKRVR